MRGLVCIGCDIYADGQLNNLAGAENDAQAIFDALTKPSSGVYEPGRSMLLKSPSYTDVVAAVTATAFDPQSDELTFYFAGHGTLKDGSYFMCVSDSRLDQLTVSAIGVTDLIMQFLEAGLRHSHIIIDSCHSGALSLDLGAFLKPHHIGSSDTPSISLLASASSDQVAMEVDGAGVVTSSIVRVLTGEVTTGSSRPFLTLFDVWEALGGQREHEGQSPIYWGMSLLEVPIFARNMLFDDSALDPSVASPLEVLGSSAAAPGVEELTRSLWILYIRSLEHFRVQELAELVGGACNDVDIPPPSLTVLVEGIVNAFGPMLSAESRAMERAEMLAAMISCLLPRTEAIVVKELISALSDKLVDAIAQALQHVDQRLSEHKFALLSDGDLFADLHYLPLRISRFLGWIGSLFLIAEEMENELVSLQASNFAASLLPRLLSDYTGSLTCVSDEQAAGLFLFLSGVPDDLLEETEQIFGLYFNSIVTSGANVSVVRVSPSDALKFTLARASGEYEGCDEFIAKPSELLAVLLLCASRLGLDDVIDDSIASLDHASGNVFLPASQLSFSDRIINDGINVSFQIGDGVWSTDDLHSFADSIESHRSDDYSTNDPEVRIASICASLIYRDRVPWYLVRRASSLT